MLRQFIRLPCKQRCLILCSRGITARFRHLLEDLRNLIPHHKKESKLDPGSDGVGRAITDIAEMRGCNTVLYLECRKRQDAYLWMGRQNGGPSVRFHVSNIHTMDELKMTGNCMKGSRPILSFDQSFTKYGHLKLMKELFVDIFGTPRGHPKSKPFVDRVMAFYYADKKVGWTRPYDVVVDDTFILYFVRRGGRVGVDVSVTEREKIVTDYKLDERMSERKQ